MYGMGSTKHVSLTNEPYNETEAAQYRTAHEEAFEQSSKVKYSLWDYYMQCTYTRYHIAYGRIKQLFSYHIIISAHQDCHCIALYCLLGNHVALAYVGIGHGGMVALSPPI
ncbi:hypothetical protein GCM10027596_41520 [Nocardioides korecus]